jgi:hypothetical protein
MINNRNDIPKLFENLNIKIGAELGVAAGAYSRKLNEAHSFDKFFCIDKWNDHHNLSEKKKVENAFKDKSNIIIMHCTFSEALINFEDNFFDFIYIDGYAHTGQDDGKTLKQWFPKLRKGGMFAGHDYDEKRWPKTFLNVNEFLKNQLGYEINFTKEKTDPSWYIIK